MAGFHWLNATFRGKSGEVGRTAPSILVVLGLINCAPQSGPNPRDAFRESVLAEFAAIDYLPGDTLAFVAVRSVDSLPPEVHRTIAAVVVPGPEASDTASLAELGIDPTRPAGAAILHWASATVVGFAEVADRAQLEAALRARYPMAERSAIGMGQIASVPARGIGLVLRGRHVFAVRSRAASKRAWSEVRLAGSEPTGALAGEPGFVDALAGLEVGRDIAAYVAMDRIADEMIHEVDDLAATIDERATELDNRVARAKKRNASTTEILALSAAARRAESQRKAAHGLFERRRQVARQLVGSWGKVAAAVDLGGDSLAVQVSAALDPDATMADILTQGSSVSAAAGSIPPDMWPLRIAASFPPPALLELLRMLDLAAYPVVSDRGIAISGSLDERLGVDLMRDLLPLVSGRIELGLGRIGQRGFDLLLGVRDVNRATALLRRIPRLRIGTAQVIPRLTNGAIAISDRAAFDRSPHWAPEHQGTTGQSRRVAVVDIDSFFWAGLVARNVGPLPGRRSPPKDGNDDVPHSTEYRTLIARFAEQNDRIAELGAALERLASERLRAIAGPFGTLTIELIATGSHLHGHGQQKLRAAALGSAIARARLRDQHFTRQREVLDASMKSALERLTQLENKLVHIRARDVQAWDRKQMNLQQRNDDRD